MRALLLTLFTAACAVAPPIDPAAVGTVAPEERYIVTTADSTITVDHLRVEADTVRGRRVTAPPAESGSELALARGSVVTLRRAVTGGPGIELALLPVVLVVALGAIFRAGYGSD